MIDLNDKDTRELLQASEDQAAQIIANGSGLTLGDLLVDTQLHFTGLGFAWQVWEIPHDYEKSLIIAGRAILGANRIDEALQLVRERAFCKHYASDESKAVLEKVVSFLAAVKAEQEGVTQ